MTETREGSELALFLAGVLSGSQQALKAELERLLIKEQRDAAELAELEKKVNDEKDFNTKLVAMESARISYCQASDAGSAEGKAERLTRSSALSNALKDLELAAAKVRKTVQYPVDLTPSTGDVNRVYCPDFP